MYFFFQINEYDRFNIYTETVQTLGKHCKTSSITTALSLQNFAAGWPTVSKLSTEEKNNYIRIGANHFGNYYSGDSMCPSGCEGNPWVTGGIPSKARVIRKNSSCHDVMMVASLNWLTWIDFNPSMDMWLRHHIHYKTWDKITYSFQTSTVSRWILNM